MSTTHALVGALCGAGLLTSVDAVRWTALTTKVALPLLVGVAVALSVSALINMRRRLPPECICVQAEPALGFVGIVPLRVSTGTAAECRVDGRRTDVRPVLHWMSAGAASFARGLDDTPKIGPIAAVTLAPAGWSTTAVALLVAGGMAGGSVLAGTRVARRLAEDLVAMDGSEALRANLTLSVHVGLGANRGLPMSTTHVATGAIAGASRGHLQRVNSSTLRDFALAWIATPLVGSAAAAIALVVLR